MLVPATHATGEARASDAGLRSATVRPENGAKPTSPSEFSVKVGGSAVEVVGVEALSPARGGAPWKVLVYFDTPLLTPDGRQRALDELSERAASLTEFGPVSIVAADPEPVELLAAGRHGHEIAESLRLFEDRTTLAGELVWRRLRFLEAVRRGEVDETRARQEMERERQLLERQRNALLDTLPNIESPGLLVLVQDGFDYRYKRFYLSRTDRLADLESDLEEAHAAWSRAIVERGWTVLALSLGEQGSEFANPRQPLIDLVESTGGEIALDTKSFSKSLAALGDRVRLTYRLPDAVDASARLEVTLAANSVRAPGWPGDPSSGAGGQVATARRAARRSAVRLLSPGRGPHLGPTRLTAITGDHEIGYVAFFLDGFLVDVAHREPFLGRVDLGTQGGVRTVRAVAFSPDALELGEDVLTLNQESRPYAVDIVGVRGEPYEGEVELSASVSTPAGRALERVEFYWNDRLEAGFDRPEAAAPLSARVRTPSSEPTDYYRVVATWDDGNRLETARMAIGAEVEDRLEVNLVELYATVTDRKRLPLDDLSREDFSVVHAGTPRPIEGFAHARNLPLTLGLAVDTSSSMEPWQDEMRDAAAVFFESVLGGDDRAFLVDFDDRARLTQAPTRRRELLVGRMGSLDFGGFTSLWDATLFALTQFEQEGGRKALVVLSDASDHGSRFRPNRCVDEALRLGVPIYMVVIEDPLRPLSPPERMVAARIARQTGGQVYYLSDSVPLGDVYAAIEADLRSQYLLTYALNRPLTAADLGDIRVEVNDPRLSVRTILGQSLRAQ